MNRKPIYWLLLSIYKLEIVQVIMSTIMNRKWWRALLIHNWNTLSIPGPQLFTNTQRSVPIAYNSLSILTPPVTGGGVQGWFCLLWQLRFLKDSLLPTGRRQLNPVPSDPSWLCRPAGESSEHQMGRNWCPAGRREAKEALNFQQLWYQQHFAQSTILRRNI